METTRQKNQNLKILRSTKPSCGDCSGFCDEALKYKLNAEAKEKKPEVCSERGIIETSEICSSFRPNVNPLRDAMKFDGMTHLIELAGKMDSRQLQALSALFRHAARTKKEGYEFGQLVYVQTTGRSNRLYLGNFMSCRILMADSKILRLMSDNGKCVITFDRNCCPTIHTVEEFEPIRKNMLEKGFYVDPEVKRGIAKIYRSIENYEIGVDSKSEGRVKTIDEVFKEKKYPKRKNDLVSLVSEIEKGYKISEPAYEKPTKKKVTKKSTVAGKRRSKGDVIKMEF